MNAADEATKSLWAGIEPSDSSVLTKNITCDVLVIGAGIAGLSCAYELAQAGMKVAVLDRGRLTGGMTARTTAHLSHVCDDGFAELSKTRDPNTARLFYESHKAGIDRIEQIVSAHNISCNFRRLDGLLFPALGMSAEDVRILDDELAAARKIDCPVQRASGLPFSDMSNAPVNRYPHQATFHPLKYTTGVCRFITAQNGLLFENAPVVDVKEEGGGVVAKTASGREISAGAAVVATNSPINDLVALHTKQAPYRTYAVTFTLPKDSLPDALYWDTADPYHYVRLNPGPGSVDYIIVGGADHKSGEMDDGGVRFEALAAWLRALVPQLGREVARWSGQVLETLDYCGHIGRNPGNERVFVVSGDSGQGITHGALAGLLVRDLVLNNRSPWEALYAPSRKPMAAAGRFLSENSTTLKNFAEYIAPGELSSYEELEPGCGAIIRAGLQKVAAYRDEKGKLHKRSAMCTHLGCHLHWNSTECCWDCPCHGSHFGIDGQVLNGPAVSDLPKIE